MKIKDKILLTVIIVLLLSVLILGYLYRNSIKENKRQTANVENLVKAKNQELILTRGEYSKSEAKWKTKIDSLTKALHIKVSNIKTITLINTIYRDTGSVMVLMKEPVLKPDKTFSIPFTFKDKCWGVAGQVLTTDKESKVRIDSRVFNNEQQLLVTRKRFLGFLWWKKDETFKAYTDCGEVPFTKITFVK